MDVREKLVELKKMLRECLHFNYDEFSCDMSLDVDLTAENIIANGVTVQEWISVKDRLPEVGSIVLVSDNETDCHIWQYTNYSERGVAMPWMDEFGIPCKTEEITHWMPLPQPPKGE